ncbi:MAG: response regulator [Flavobacterium sp.]|nr:response regulator [Flavobacterium sp.]
MNQEKKNKILIVEDDKFLTRILSLRLEKSGFEVEPSFDGEDALEKIKKEEPDLIVLDLILPKKDGFEVLEELKKIKKDKKIPVVILSNLGQDLDIERGLELGVVDYIVKTEVPLSEAIVRIKNNFRKNQ